MEVEKGVKGGGRRGKRQNRFQENSSERRVFVST